MNIKLNEEAKARLNHFRDLHKARGLKLKQWSEIVSALILEAGEVSWEKKIEENTPRDSAIDLALKDPEMAEKIHKLILKTNKSKIKENRKT
tara:strand:+ start:56 stop:331 length:276 start_codon:yes stop_codon:yes gene_type:complete